MHMSVFGVNVTLLIVIKVVLNNMEQTIKLLVIKTDRIRFIWF